MSMCSANQPSSRAEHRRDAQREALLAQQGVAAVARAVGNDLAGLGEVDDVLVLRVARPSDVASGRAKGQADRVQARHELAVTEYLEGAAAHARHDAHAHRDVGRVGDLDTDVPIFEPRGPMEKGTTYIVRPFITRERVR